LYSQVSPADMNIVAAKVTRQIGDLAVGHREVVGGVSDRAVVVDDRDFTARNTRVAGVGDLVGPGDFGTWRQDRHAGAIGCIFVVVVGAVGLLLLGPLVVFSMSIFGVGKSATTGSCSG
jgi:hypothetical protein